MWTFTRYFNPSFINTIDGDEIYNGRWWLPDYPDDKVSGVLYLRKKGGIRLNLIGMFLSDSSQTMGHNLADHDIIIGELVPGNGPVTLIYCRERERKSPYMHNSAEGAVQRFKVDHLLFGHQIEKNDSLKFTSFEFSTTYLVDWVNPKQLEFKLEGKSSIVKTLPNSNLVIKEEDYEIIITSWAATSFAPPYNSAQNTSIEVKLNKGISIEMFKERFQNPLIDLIQFGSSFLNSLTFMNVLLDGSGKSQKIISTNEFDRINREPDPIQHYALFRLSDFGDTWHSFIINWLKFHTRAKHIFRLYFDSMHVSFQFPVTKFLNTIQAVESYHSERVQSNAINLAKNNFKDNKERVLSLFGEKDFDLKNWTDRELSFFPTLRVKLNELFSDTEAILSEVIKDRESFISKSIDTRNYYTHYNLKTLPKAATGTELDALTNALRLLLNFHLLMECGVSKEKSSELVLDNYLFDYVKQLARDNRLWGN